MRHRAVTCSAELLLVHKCHLRKGCGTPWDTPAEGWQGC